MSRLSQPSDELATTSYADLGEHRLWMILHCVRGDEEVAGNIGGRMPGDDLTADVALARGQAIRREQQAD